MVDHLNYHICESIKPLTLISMDTLKMAFNNYNCHIMGKIKNTHLLGSVNSGDIAQPKSHLIEVKSCHSQDPQRPTFEDQIKYRMFASFVEFKTCTTLLFGLDSLRYNITLYIYIYTLTHHLSQKDHCEYTTGWWAGSRGGFGMGRDSWNGLD